MIIIPIIHLAVIYIIFKIGKLIKNIINKISNKQISLNLNKELTPTELEIKEINQFIKENDSVENLSKISKLQRKLIVLNKKLDSENKDKKEEKLLTLKDNFLVKILLILCENKILTVWISSFLFSNYSYEFKFHHEFLWPIHNFFGEILENGNFKFKFTFFYGIIAVRFLNIIDNIFK